MAAAFADKHEPLWSPPTSLERIQIKKHPKEWRTVGPRRIALTIPPLSWGWNHLSIRG